MPSSSIDVAAKAHFKFDAAISNPEVYNVIAVVPQKDGRFTVDLANGSALLVDPAAGSLADASGFMVAAVDDSDMAALVALLESVNAPRPEDGKPGMATVEFDAEATFAFNEGTVASVARGFFDPSIIIARLAGDTGSVAVMPDGELDNEDGMTARLPPSKLHDVMAVLAHLTRPALAGGARRHRKPAASPRRAAAAAAPAPAPAAAAPAPAPAAAPAAAATARRRRAASPRKRASPKSRRSAARS